MKKIITLLAIGLFPYLPLSAQDGTPDSTFAGDGIALLDFFGQTETGNGIVVQPDGKILAVASMTRDNNFELGVVRINEDGSLDSTFADNGAFLYDNPGVSDLGYDIKLLEDGSILACGSFGLEPADTDFFVYKLTKDGLLDSTFAENGARVIRTGAGNDYARAMAVSEDGTIFLTGDTGVPGFSFASNTVVKLDADGHVDSTWADQGAFFWNTDSTRNESLQLEILADGNLVVSGRAVPAGSDRIVLYKVLADGTGLDTTFGTGGVVLAPFQGKGYGMTVHPNGNILVAGNNLGGQGFDAVVAAYNQDGTPNMAFGTNGATLMNYGINDVGLSIAVQQDGKIIVGGESGGTFFFGPPRAFFSARLDALGVVDSTWGDNGFVTTPTSDFFAFSNGCTVQPDGKVLLVGATATPQTGNDLTFIRYGNFIDQDMDGVRFDQDCDDLDAAVFQEVELFVDADGDGYDDGQAVICMGDEVPAGYTMETNGTDCDDTDSEAFQLALLFVDADGDGYDDGQQEVCFGTAAPDGFSEESAGSDCDDTDPETFQLALLFVDADGDGYDNGRQEVCFGTTAPDGFSEESAGDDCDDDNPDIFPGAEEIPNNGVDEDCDGMDLVVSVRETALASRFELYPNPASGTEVVLEVTGPAVQAQAVQLLDATGRQLQQLALDFNQNQVVINIAGLPAGLYILAIQTAEGVAAKRLIIE